MENGATHLAHVHLVSVFARRSTICGEDGGAVAIGVVVDQTDGIVKTVCLEDNQDGPEDLLFVALHLGLRDGRRNILRKDVSRQTALKCSTLFSKPQNAHLFDKELYVIEDKVVQ